MLEQQKDINVLEKVDSICDDRDGISEKLDEMEKACLKLMITLLDESSFDAEGWKTALEAYIATYGRILYSIVSQCIHVVYKENPEMLFVTLKRIRSIYDKTEDSHIKTIKLKLYDHINLVIQQASVRKEIQALRVETLELLKKTQEENNQKSQEAGQKHEKLVTTLRNSEKNYIAILGIFAAIVLAFTGSLIFSTSVFEHMHLVSVYRAVGMALIIGMVLINVLHFMFYCIERCMERKDFKASFAVLAIVNGVFIILLGCNYGAWCCGKAKKRDASITQAYPSSAQEKTKASSVANSPHPHNTPPMVLQKETVSIFDATANKGPTHKDLD